MKKGWRAACVKLQYIINERISGGCVSMCASLLWCSPVLQLQPGGYCGHFGLKTGVLPPPNTWMTLLCVSSIIFVSLEYVASAFVHWELFLSRKCPQINRWNTSFGWTIPLKKHSKKEANTTNDQRLMRNHVPQHAITATSLPAITSPHIMQFSSTTRLFNPEIKTFTPSA